MLGFATKDELFQIHPSQLSPPAQPDGRVSFEKAEEMMAKAKRDGSHRFEWVHRRASGEDFWVEVSLTAIPMQDHYIIHTAWRDITDRKNAEAAILEEREFSDAVLESVPGLLYLYDDQGKLRRWNRQHETLTGYSAEELAGMNLLDWFRHDERSMADVREGIERTFREGHGSTEGNLITKSGKVIPFYFTATTLDLKGHTYFTGIGIDITDRKKAESAIQASLDEKVVLLREIHHRVKNNLQIIISLVNLQMRQSEDPEVRQIMAETQNRVRAMSLVHEKLYGSESLSRIDFGDYTRYLAKQLSSFFGSDSMKVRLDISLGRIMVDINTAVPLGLIMNELISNSLKHAFPGGREGTIAISGTVDNNVITFVVRDNGIGIPEDLDWKNTPSLGMHLITRLVEQVDGTITLDRNEGTEFTLTVKRGQSSGGSG
jgi:PAS domain S-box-containing protein